MDNRWFRLYSLLILSAILMACSVSTGANPGTQQTNVAATIIMELTAKAPTATLTPTATPLATSTFTPVPPTATLVPTATQAPTVLPTSTVPVISCNSAAFITDVTIPDGTELVQNQIFTKTWRVTNTGSCAWNSQYQLIFVGGEQLGGPNAVNIPNIINPGGTVDVSVQLTAPSSTGDFTGYWKFKSPDGSIFGVGANSALSVVIKTKSLLANITLIVPLPFKPSIGSLLKPDLVITDMTVNNGQPITPKKPVQVRLTLYNDSVVEAENFDVEFWGLESYPNRDCAWDIDSIEGKTSQVLTCSMTYPSWYTNGLKAKAVVDRLGMTAELDENNNTKLVPLTFNH